MNSPITATSGEVVPEGVGTELVGRTKMIKDDNGEGKDKVATAITSQEEPKIRFYDSLSR